MANDIKRLRVKSIRFRWKTSQISAFKWLTKSPDVSISLYPEVISPLLNSKSKYKQELLIQYLLSIAAFTIENELESGK